MNFSGITLVVLAVSSHSFQHASIASNSPLKKNMAPRGSNIAIHSHHSHKQITTSFNENEEHPIPLSNAGINDSGRQLRQMSAGVVAATAISFAAATLDPSQLSATVANAVELNLSKGAVVIDFTAPTESTKLKKFDSSQEQKLIQTLLKNRKELGASIGRIQQSIQNELLVKDSYSSPTAAAVWAELYQEILSIEGDVVPKVQITPPADLATAVKDLRNGNINLLVNGEIINVSVEPSFGEDEDDLVIRIKGFKGGVIPKATDEAPQPSTYYGPIRRWLSHNDEFWSFWGSPTTLSGAKGPVFLSGITNGEVVIGGAVSAVVFSYVVAYCYYVQQNEAEATEAASKQSAIAEKTEKKKKEAAAKKKAIVEEEKQNMADSSSESLGDAEESSAPVPATITMETPPEKSTRRHRFRFWKNRQNESK